MNAIVADLQIDPSKLRLFVYALEQTAIHASVEDHLQISGLTEDEIASRLTKAVQEHFINS